MFAAVAAIGFECMSAHLVHRNTQADEDVGCISQTIKLTVDLRHKRKKQTASAIRATSVACGWRVVGRGTPPFVLSRYEAKTENMGYRLLAGIRTIPYPILAQASCRWEVTAQRRVLNLGIALCPRRRGCDSYGDHICRGSASGHMGV